jgi:hypothetical protein
MLLERSRSVIDGCDLSASDNLMTPSSPILLSVLSDIIACIDSELQEATTSLLPPSLSD